MNAYLCILLLFGFNCAKAESDNSTQETVYDPGSPPGCAQDATFTSLDECIDACKNNTSKTKQNSKVAWKVLRINSTEYTISEGHILSALNLEDVKNYSQHKYVLNPDKTASICYGLSDAFVSCPSKWKMEKQEMEHKNPTFEAYSKLDQSSYKTGEFYIDLKDGGTVLCVPSKLDSGNTKVALIGSAISAKCLASVVGMVSTSKKIKVDRALKYHFLLLAIAFLTLATEFVITEMTTSYCGATGYLKHYLLLSGFVFLNLSFLHGCLVKKLATGQNQGGFFMYKMIGFGLPLGITLIPFIMETMEVSKFNPYIKALCWFPKGSWSGIIYYYLWIAVSVFANIIIFTCCTHSKSTLNQNNKWAMTKSSVHLLLLIITGIFITIKVVYWLVEEYTFFYYLDQCTYFLGLFELIAILCTSCSCRRKKRSETNELKSDADANAKVMTKL